MSGSHVWNNTIGKWFKASSDEMMDVPISTDHWHSKIHDGDAYHVSDLSQDMGAETNDQITIQFTTPAATTGLVHAQFGVWAGGVIQFSVREAFTGGGAGGGAAIIKNKLREGGADDGHGMTFLKDNTAATGGTFIFNNYYPANIPSVQVHNGNKEWVLKASTAYQMRAYNTAAVYCMMFMEFYMHISKH